MSKQKPNKATQPNKPTWQDALAAIAAKDEQQQRFARRWGKMYRQARADLQSDEVVVFLGEDARKVLGLDAAADSSPTAPVISVFQRPGKSAVVTGGSVALVALAGYALSLWRVSRVI